MSLASDLVLTNNGELIWKNFHIDMKFNKRATL